MISRVAIMSDLHIEIDRKRGISATPRTAGHPHHGPDLRPLLDRIDMCILAGDIDRGLAAFEYANAVSSYLEVPTVLVAGNHEFYTHRRSELLEQYREKAAATGGRVRFLENDETVVWLNNSPHRVLGCTLWTDLRLYGDRAARELLASGDLDAIYDYRRIMRDDGSFIGAEDPITWHLESKAWLARKAVAAHEGPTVIVTHHAPLLQSIAPRFRGSPLNAVFVNNLEDLVQETAAELWVHGHTHHDVDMIHGKTRIVSRQRGYPIERSTNFHPMIAQL
jgi:predicted phosphodiesterase